ncbi:DUF2799 domain-containing protein [Enterovibrio sp. ZSDZ42]|uniref:DUF2799 domain-containing protein n=1 Tax=Enterovibrio gelatinilyticus TaxID=2899819 RepID=A0ABT5R4U1_9GAMM|nr:DUF2799 domain-containing protein [Enterovibrio sp. ZSDZ42]MDD1795195.1 DUF2799 domain-containing protein [Enterovibrio sp. ZSDZ42]
MRLILVSVFIVFSLAGCASKHVASLSAEQNWSGLANYDVEAGRKARSSEDLTSLGAIDADQQRLYLSVYEAYAHEYCKPENGYHMGIIGKPRNSVCIDDSPKGWLYEDNWKAGLEAGRFF